MDDPGLKPISPVIFVAPVLVMVEPARTTNVDEPERDTVFWLDV